MNAKELKLRGGFTDLRVNETDSLPSADREIQPHIYSPDYQLMGDCRVCGHGQNKPWHSLSSTPAAAPICVTCGKPAVGACEGSKT